MLIRRVLRHLIVLAAWALAAGLVVVTLGPQSVRPHVGNAQLERFGAYWLTGLVFAFAYPRHLGRIAVGLSVGAIVLELSQLIAPGRDAGLPDAVAKVCGGWVGVATGAAGLWARKRFAPRVDDPETPAARAEN